MADLQQLEEQIVGLSLLDAAALVKKLEERLGVSAAAAAPVMVAGGGAAAAGAGSGGRRSGGGWGRGAETLPRAQRPSPQRPVEQIGMISTAIQTRAGRRSINSVCMRPGCANGIRYRSTCHSPSP